MAVLPLSPGASSSTKIPVGSPVYATYGHEGHLSRRQGQTLLPSPGSENYHFLLYRIRLQQVVKSLLGDFRPQASQILPQLYISDLYTATSPQILDDLGITHILSLKSKFTKLPFHSPCVSPCSSPVSELSILSSPTHSSCSSSSSTPPSPVSKSRFRAISIMLEDGDDVLPPTPKSPSPSRRSTKIQPNNDLLSVLPITTQFIQETLARKDSVNSRVLVHCDTGKSVSAAVVLGYLIRVHFHSYEKALEFLKSRRRIAEPHPSFVHQLKEWERRVRMELESTLEKGLRQRVEEQQREEQYDNFEPSLKIRCGACVNGKSGRKGSSKSPSPSTLPPTPPLSPPPASLEPG